MVFKNTFYVITDANKDLLHLGEYHGEGEFTTPRKATNINDVTFFQSEVVPQTEIKKYSGCGYELHKAHLTII